MSNLTNVSQRSDIERVITTCKVKDNHDLQTTCCYYQKATNADRCIHLRDEWICTWREGENV
jgi:hypothetical protein